MNKRTPLLFLFFLILLIGCQIEKNTPNQVELSVTWEVLSNIVADKPQFRSAFTLKNNGDDALGSSGWALYFNQLPRPTVPGSIKGPANIEVIEGDFFRLVPDSSFHLQPGDSVRIVYDTPYWAIKETDAPVGLYLVFSDSTGKETGRQAINDYRIKPLVTKEQTSRFKNDLIPVPTPNQVYEQNRYISLLDDTALLKVIPNPYQTKSTREYTNLSQSTEIHYQNGLEKEAAYLAKVLEKYYGTTIKTSESTATGKQTITLLQQNVAINGNTTESYLLEVAADGNVIIKANNTTGIFYGIQSFLSLFPVQALQKHRQMYSLPVLSIKDAPSFAYRGMHLDVARNFQKKDQVLKLIDVMARYKLNKLHLHLTGDEGWRLEIPTLPELTQVGARRGHTLTETDFLQPSYGSGPDPNDASSHGNGFYTVDEFKEIITYAHQKHIEVIPELGLPGHARAAIVSMNARYKRLMAEGKPDAARKYLLVDTNDRSQYHSVQYYDDNVVCVCKESVYTFYDEVVAQVQNMYKEAQVPLTTIHTGGDEVPQNVWEKSPICQAFLAEHPEYTSAKNLQSYFLKRVQKILSDKGLKTAGWEEVAMIKNKEGKLVVNPAFAGKDVIPFVWNNLWGNQDLAYKLANTGYPVVLCGVTHLYFDMAYTKHPKEPGYYWGGLTDSRNVYEFLPFDVFKSISSDPFGKPFDPQKDYQQMERLKPEAKENILGIQAELWSETVKGPEMMEYYILPRLLVFAERAWNGAPDWGNIEDAEKRNAAVDEVWNVFANTLGQKELPKLNYLFGGYHYRIPVPGAVIKDGKLLANIALPGFTIRYTLDGSEPNKKSAVYSQAINIDGTVKLRAFDSKGRGGRTVMVKP